MFIFQSLLCYDWGFSRSRCQLLAGGEQLKMPEDSVRGMPRNPKPPDRLSLASFCLGQLLGLLTSISGPDESQFVINPCHVI